MFESGGKNKGTDCSLLIFFEVSIYITQNRLHVLQTLKNCRKFILQNNRYGYGVKCTMNFVSFV